MPMRLIRPVYSARRYRELTSFKLLISLESLGRGHQVRVQVVRDMAASANIGIWFPTW
jgi:hypothetical protein